MSIVFTPVQWNRSKYFYDAVLIGVCALYIIAYLHWAPEQSASARAVDGATLRMRAFGSCAFFMLSAILCIGPMGRLDKRFLPLLYNRRHFGVLTAFVALAHALFVLDWYFAFSPRAPLLGLLTANDSYAQALGFPFEILGLAALLMLGLLAATSHDFWLRFLGPPVWKRLHLLIYPAYLLVTAHLALGALQSTRDPVFAVCVIGAAGLVAVLHLWAGLSESTPRAEGAANTWERVGGIGEIAEGAAKIVLLSTGERVAVFRHQGALSAISNHCAHQNGPLGEGRIIDGCVTCPWHGYQYRLRDGVSPAPYTERVPTYRLRLEDGMIWVDNRANPPGTEVEPLRVTEAIA